mmetsp:Transcript_31477/g.74800  ORF Transcript_31477/g.74800 Transcript_31477/m.74800 type:complete len:186 (+) Transcript_31477:2309-2866(+)
MYPSAGRAIRQGVSEHVLMRAGMLSRGKVDPETVREVIESSLMEGARASGKRWITAVGPGKERMELSGIGDVATAAVVNVAVDMMRGQNELPDDIREAVDESPETDDGDLDMKVSRLTGLVQQVADRVKTLDSRLGDMDRWRPNAQDYDSGRSGSSSPHPRSLWDSLPSRLKSRGMWSPRSPSHR